MTAKLVDLVKTPHTIQEVIQSLITAWYKEYNTYPSKENIGVLFSQWSLETGQGKACYNNNFFNVKYISKNPDLDSDDIQYFMLPNTWEINGNGQKVIYQPPHPQTWFRSFNSLDEGVTHHFNLLKNKRYKEAWTAVESGNPAAFSHLLKLKGYYTASESDYTKGLNFFFNKFMKDNTFDNIIAQLTTVPIEPVPTEPMTPAEPTVINIPSTVIVVDEPQPPQKKKMAFFKSLKEFFFGA
jgi:hypothetical protein